MSTIGSFPFGHGRIEVQRTRSPDSGVTALWLRRIDDGPEITVAVKRYGNLVFTNGIPESDRPAIAVALEKFLLDL
ncbi:hypothetical protein [Glycomyces salinus]|uniref:hypothetical protein n=1 Tax=Glycomyces salinus TaxID=980294 RepID=UPI0018EC3073|nr:hypothetical protein [Glycomyces salinus]